MPEGKEVKPDKTFEEKKVYDVLGVEIFAAGKHNGEKYTDNDIDAMVSAHTEVGGLIKPYLKLGHDEKQGLLQSDGYPAAGWIDNLRRVGHNLVADFRNIPAKIKGLLERKAYGRLSSEIYWDLPINGKRYSRVLKAVALLGGDTPAVKTLDDFVGLYDGMEVARVHSVPDATVHVTEGEEADKMADEAEVKAYKEAADKAVAERDAALAAKAEADQKFAEHIATEKRAERDRAIDDMLNSAVRDAKVLPAQFHVYKALLLDGVMTPDAEGVKTYSYTDNEKPIERKFKDSIELVAEIIASMPKLVNFDETPAPAPAPAPVAPAPAPEKSIEDKVMDYQAEHKCDIRTAIREVSKETK